MRDAAKARLDSLRSAVLLGTEQTDTSAVEAMEAAVAADSTAVVRKGKSLGIEGIENHSDEGFVEVQLPKDGQNISREEKQALKKATRELRRQQKRLEREERKAEKAARRQMDRAMKERNHT